MFTSITICRTSLFTTHRTRSLRARHDVMCRVIPRGAMHGLIIAVTIVMFAPGAAWSGGAPSAAADRMTEFLSEKGLPLPADWQPNLDAMTFFVVHGFRDTGTSEQSLRQAQAIRQRYERDNVVIVSWHVLPCTPRGGEQGRASFFEVLHKLATDYARSVDVAQRVGREISAWMKEKRISPANTVLSGHSLGAHIAAFASNACALPELFGTPVRAILAADPAGPLFEGRLPAERLDPSDAQEVIVVHTTDVFGTRSAVGTIDTYVSWPEAHNPDTITQHSYARELVTASFLSQELVNADGTPFGANAIGGRVADAQPKAFRVTGETLAAIASRD